jgi:hypothetical protein
MLGIVGPRQWQAAAGASAADEPGQLPTNHSGTFAPNLGLALPAGVAALAIALTWLILHHRRSQARMVLEARSHAASEAQSAQVANLQARVDRMEGRNPPT